MEEALVSVYRSVVLQYRISLEDIVEDPEFRTLFLARVQEAGVEKLERDVLHAMTRLRKSGRLPRSRDILKNSSSIVAVRRAK